MGRSLGSKNRAIGGYDDESPYASEVARFFREHNTKGGVIHARGGGRHGNKERPFTASPAMPSKQNGHVSAKRAPRHRAEPETKAQAADLAHILAGQTWHTHWSEGGGRVSGLVPVDQGLGIDAGLHEQREPRPWSANGAAIIGQRGLISERQDLQRDWRRGT